MRRVKVIAWGDISNPDAPTQWGLMVGRSYVCRGTEVVLHPTRELALADAARLRSRLRNASEGATT